jgi:hypothetical protein
LHFCSNFPAACGHWPIVLRLHEAANKALICSPHGSLTRL